VATRTKSSTIPKFIYRHLHCSQIQNIISAQHRTRSRNISSSEILEERRKKIIPKGRKTENVTKGRTEVPTSSA